MVTVDMSKTRQQISKRKRRIRRSQRRRLQKAHRQQQAQLLAAGAAKKARQQAVQNWLEEEKRRDRQRQNGIVSPSTPRVRFADNVSVTEIPTVPTHSLPKPVSSPTGVRLVREGADQPMAGVALMRGANGLCFSVLYADEDGYDEDDDPDFVPNALSDEIGIGLSLPTRPRRRIVPQSVPISTPSASAKPANPDTSHSPNASPTTSSPPHHKKSAQSTKPPNNASSPKLNGIAKSSKRKRTHSQMLSAQHSASPDASPNASPNASPKASPSDSPDPAETKTSPAKPSDSPRRRKKKKRKLIHAGQSPEQNGHHQPKSPASAVRQSHNDTNSNSPQPSFTSVKGEANKQNGELVNGDYDDSEIDAMFGEMVQRKAQIRSEQRSRKKADRPNGEKPVSDGHKGKSKRKSPTRYTEEGFRIMSYDELKADQPAGLNGECPFDCSCCF